MTSPAPWSRRHVLKSLMGGSLLVPGIISDLLARDAVPVMENPLAPRRPHHAPRAKSVIFLYMSGGVSHLESCD